MICLCVYLHIFLFFHLQKTEIASVCLFYKVMYMFVYQVICMCVYIQIVPFLRTHFTIIASFEKILTVFGIMLFKSKIVTFLQKTMYMFSYPVINLCVHLLFRITKTKITFFPPVLSSEYHEYLNFISD